MNPTSDDVILLDWIAQHTDPSASNEARYWAALKAFRDRAQQLALAIEVAANALDRDYSNMPRDKYPGPPTAIISNLRHVLDLKPTTKH